MAQLNNILKKYEEELEECLSHIRDTETLLWLQIIPNQVIAAIGTCGDQYFGILIILVGDCFGNWWEIFSIDDKSLPEVIEYLSSTQVEEIKKSDRFEASGMEAKHYLNFGNTSDSYILSERIKELNIPSLEDLTRLFN